MNDQDITGNTGGATLNRRAPGSIRTRNIHQSIFLVALAILLALGVACRKTSQQKQSEPVRPTHEGVGVVLAIDKENDTIQINHEEIKGYMPAMTMNFRLKKKLVVGDIKAGDHVAFTLKDTGNGYVITQLKKQ